MLTKTAKETYAMIEYCKCNKCKHKKECNFIDLFNCYATKKLAIKVKK